MKKENVELMRMAKESLTGKWGLAIGTMVLYFIITTAVQSAHWVGGVAGLFITGPLSFGLATFSLAISRNEEAKIDQLFVGFSQFMRMLEAYLTMIIIIFGYMLLLIVPGIIKAISYSMTFYILVDDPNISPRDALKKSIELMEGYKLDYFYLGLRFLGLALLCILTLGIGFLWLMPYMQVTNAKFYEYVIENRRIEGSQPVSDMV